MKNALNSLTELSQDEKARRGILFTPSEILGQVDLWKDSFEIVKRNINTIKSFIESFKKNEKITAILTGAGTSEFIGYCIEGLIRRNLYVPVNVFSTTNIVTNPDDIFIKDYHTLLISFARSGNSPESIGAVKIAEMSDKKIHHLIITCNSDGNLIKTCDKMNNTFTICLDKRTNDRGLAMTSSFSNMVIAAQSLSHIFSFEDYSESIDKIVECGKSILAISPDIVNEVSSLDFNRAVFLGNGSNLGTAVESHLKLQELTSGSVMCGYDTFLGLRHGPEAVINENTIVVAYVSNDKYISKYEEDLIKEIKEKKIGKALVVVGRKITDEIKKESDYIIEYDPLDRFSINDELTPPINVIIGQLFGLFKSINLGFKPDSPSENGIINRVVKGVKVYNPSSFHKRGKFEIIAKR